LAHHFDFPSVIQQTAQSLRTPTNQVCHLVACGYFLAAKRFYPAQTFHQRNIDYIAKTLNLSSEQIDPRDYDSRTRFRHRNQILDFYGFRPFDQEAKTLITPEIEAMACSQLRPKLILFRTVDILVREKVEIPGYCPLAEIILSAINARKKELAVIIERILSHDTKDLLDGLSGSEQFSRRRACASENSRVQTDAAEKIISVYKTS